MSRNLVPTFTALDSLAFEDLVSVVTRGTLDPVLTTQNAVRRRSVSQEPVQKPEPASSPSTIIASTAGLSHAVAQVAEAVGSKPAHRNVRVCDHLDPMDRLDVEPPDADQQELESELRQAQGRFTARRLLVQDGTVLKPCMPVRGYPPPRTLPKLRPAHPVQKALSHKAPHKLADGSVTLEPLAALGTTTNGPHAGACTASCCFLLDFTKETRLREVKRFWSCHLKRWRTTRKPSVSSPLPTTSLALARATRLAATRSTHRGRSSSTQSRAMTNSGQHRSGTRLGTFRLEARTVLCRSSASLRMPTSVALRSLLVPGSLLLRQPLPLHPFATALTLRS